MKYVLIFFFLAAFACQEKVSNTKKVHDYVSIGLDSLSSWLNEEFIPLAGSATDSAVLTESFLKGRKLYKQTEFAIEYFFANSARNLNGPPLPEIEPEEHIVLEPGGFQVIEELLFPFDSSSRKDLVREATKMKSILVRVNALWEGTSFRDDQVFDAVRFQCFRIITLGISGFDTPLSMQSISELPPSLQTIRDVIQLYANRPAAALQAADRAIAYASSQSNFNEFDRMHFITEYINPLTTALLDFQTEIGIPAIKNVYALNGDIHTLFDSGAFNLNYFTPDANSRVTPARVALGRKLFTDPVLSLGNSISCASCHQPEKNFTDGLTKSRALGSKGFLQRNTPSLAYAGLQKNQFYDMRSAFLEDQVKNVVENEDEIHGNLGKAALQLGKDSAYRRMFTQAFPAAGLQVTERNILVTISSYIRSLASFDSRFDRYMGGDREKLTPEEIKGFNVFMGKAKCGICHFMPLFNGTVPPAFIFTESEVIGVPSDPKGSALDPDSGRYAIYRIDNFRNAFKTPTVRNTRLTTPYMHNGVYSSLEEVVEFYNRGGGAGLGLKIDNQTLPFDSLMLSQGEQKALVAFMHSLDE